MVLNFITVGFCSNAPAGPCCKIFCRAVSGTNESIYHSLAGFDAEVFDSVTIADILHHLPDEA